MTYNTRKPTHEWVAKCEACGKSHLRNDLVRQLQPRAQPKTANWFLASSYDPTFWAMAGAVDEGRVSHSDNSFELITDQATNTTEHGTQTWQATGALEHIAPFNLTGKNFATIALNVGYYQQTTGVGLVMEIVLVDGVGPNIVYLARQVLGTSRFEARCDLSTLADPSSVTVRFNFVCLPGTYWWTDGFQVDFDLLEGQHMPWIPTSGVAVEIPGNRREFGAVVVCKDCRNRGVIQESPGYEYTPEDLPDMAEQTEIY